MNGFRRATAADGSLRPQGDANNGHGIVVGRGRGDVIVESRASGASGGPGGSVVQRQHFQTVRVHVLLERRQRARPGDHGVDRRDRGHQRAAVMVAGLTVVVGRAATPVVPRVIAERLTATGGRLPGSPVLVGAMAAHAEPAEQHEQIAAVLLREQRVQVRVGARVERIEEHQQEFRLGHVDERVTGQRGQAEKRHRRPARKVREHQQRHPLGHGHVRPGHRGHGLPATSDRHVHLGVARAYHYERHSVEYQQREQVQLVGHRRVFHRQANAETRAHAPVIVL